MQIPRWAAAAVPREATFWRLWHWARPSQWARPFQRFWRRLSPRPRLPIRCAMGSRHTRAGVFGTVSGKHDNAPNHYTCQLHLRARQGVLHRLPLCSLTGRTCLPARPRCASCDRYRNRARPSWSASGCAIVWVACRGAIVWVACRGWIRSRLNECGVCRSGKAVSAALEKWDGRRRR